MLIVTVTHMELVVQTLKWPRAFVNVSYHTFYIKNQNMKFTV